LEKWRSEGKVDPENRPIFLKMKGFERTFAKQLWFQRDPTKPVWQLGKYDHITNMGLIVMTFYGALAAMYCYYRLIVPKEQDIFIYENWERWRKEAHH